MLSSRSKVCQIAVVCCILHDLTLNQPARWQFNSSNYNFLAMFAPLPGLHFSLHELGAKTTQIECGRKCEFSSLCLPLGLCSPISRHFCMFFNEVLSKHRIIVSNFRPGHCIFESVCILKPLLSTLPLVSLNPPLALKENRKSPHVR